MSCSAPTESNIAINKTTLVNHGAGVDGSMAVDGVINYGVGEDFDEVTWWQVDLESDESEISQIGITVLSK